MHRILIATLIGLTFLVSGCQNGPWNFAATADDPKWDGASLDYLVQQDQPARERNRDVAENQTIAANAEEPSQSILPKIQPIDPAELTRKIQAQRKKNRERFNQLVANAPRITNPRPGNQQRFAESNPRNPLQPKSSQLAPRAIEPESIAQSVNHPAHSPAMRAGHPLRPVKTDPNSQVADANANANTLTPKTNSNPDEVTIKNLPPMNSPPNRLDSGLVASSPHPLVPKHSATPSSQFDVRQVSYEQEEDLPESAKPLQDSSPERDSALSTDVADANQPKPDKFTDADFYRAGWCQKAGCQDNCPTHAVRPIAHSFDGSVPAILPVQLQTDERIQQWDLPIASAGQFKPVGDFATSGEPELRLPGLGQNVTPATDLPVPSNENGQATPNDGSLVIPVSAVEELNLNELDLNKIDRFVRNIENADFHTPGVATDKPATLTWSQQLEMTIQSIQQQVQSSSDLTEQQQLIGKLELLRLLPTELDDQQQQYLRALTDLLQTTADPGQSNLYETGQTLDQLRNAVSYLESMASMKVVNASFCTKVTGFGQFIPTKGTRFKAGQQVLVYCEIENHSSQPKVVQGQALSSTRLAGSYIVYDANQKVVQQDKFPVVEDLARQRRRDFYMHIPFTIGDLPPGHYTYQLMIDDVGGGKSASLEPTLQFEVR